MRQFSRRLVFIKQYYLYIILINLSILLRRHWFNVTFAALYSIQKGNSVLCFLKSFLNFLLDLSIVTEEFLANIEIMLRVNAFDLRLFVLLHN